MAKRRRSTGFEAWLNAAQTPMYLLDKRRQVTIFNHGCEELTGWSSDDVVGELCDYTSPDDDAQLDQMLSTLCPAPEVFDGAALTVAIDIPHRNGTTASRMLHHFPMYNRDGVIDRVLTFVLPLGRPQPAAAPSPAQKLHAELAFLRTTLRSRYGFSSVIAVSTDMQRVMEQVHLGAACTASIHFAGEAGTGREHLARVVHNESQLSARGFVPLDCAVLSAVELQATVRRMFDKQPGSRAVLPHLQTGTLFFDSVEQLPRDIQRMLVESWDPDEAEFPARLMTSSTWSLESLAGSGDIVPDFLRLCGTLEIKPSPLRSRLEDIPLLIQLFVEQKNAGVHRQVEGLSEETTAELLKYNWPGNLAELRAVLDEAIDNCDGSVINPTDLPMRFRAGMDARRTSPPVRLAKTELEPLLAEVEREHIQRVLEACNGNRTETAKLLGLTRPKLYRRLEQLGLD